MTCELDHVFICVSKGAPEADLLRAMGLAEGAPNTHPGQGTACRRFFFANAYLEFLWVENADEAQSAVVQPLHLWERWVNRGGDVCPFGVCTRPVLAETGNAPFQTWDYRPPYLPDSMAIQVGVNSDALHEPLLFHLHWAQRPDSYPEPRRQPLERLAGLREITRVEIISPPAGNPSQELAQAAAAGLLALRDGSEFLLEMGFDGEPQGKAKDFRPGLPLVLMW